ncbi:MAG TPA: hypothetical protein PLR26_03855 [Bacilli bacterium]|nr:hypothetical protein [Bacilli bacterium]
MKKANIKKILKNHIVNTTPNIHHLIDINQITIEPLMSQIRPNIKTFRQQRFAFKMLFTILLITINVLAIFSIPLVGDHPDDEIIVNPIPLSHKEEIYAFSAASGLTAYTVSFDYNKNNLLRLSSHSLLIEDEIDQITQYLYVVESLVGDKSDMVITSSDSAEKPGYSYKISYQTIDLTNQLRTYSLYYNEEVVDDDTTRLQGIIELDTLEYHVEITDTTKEDERKITVRLNQNQIDANYIKIEHIMEEDEQKFSYEVIEMFETIHSFTIKVEEENNRIKAEIEYESDVKKLKLEFKRKVENTISTILIEYELEHNDEEEEGLMLIQVIFDSNTQMYKYVFQIETNQIDKVLEKDRFDRSKEDDEDDDDDEEDEEDEEDDDGDDDEDIEEDEEDEEDIFNVEIYYYDSFSL